MQLNAAGTAVVGEPDENMPFKTVNRYRDVAIRPDGLALFIATDTGGNTQDASGRPASSVENPGAILEFTLEDRQAGNALRAAAAKLGR
jgi:glucose/arabinose dehydrogenase